MNTTDPKPNTNISDFIARLEEKSKKIEEEGVYLDIDLEEMVEEEEQIREEWKKHLDEALKRRKKKAEIERRLHNEKVTKEYGLKKRPK